MYKKLTIIIGIALVLTGVLSWQLRPSSQADELDDLLAGLGDDYLYGFADCEVDECCIAYKAAMGHVEKAWSENLNKLTDQEKPASAMVDEAYENLRTYNCWLEYICRAVEYSSYAPPETAEGGLTKKQIGVIPGCKAPEDLGIVTTWDSFVNFLKEDWDLVRTMYSAGGEATVNMDFPDSFFVNNKIPYFPQCMSDITNKNASPDLITARDSYQRCIAVLDSKFACKDDEDSLKKCTSESIAFVKLESTLKRAHADQKARVLEDKLSSIITKMLTMEMHAEYLKTKLTNLEKLYSCYPPKCT